MAIYAATREGKTVKLKDRAAYEKFKKQEKLRSLKETGATEKLKQRVIKETKRSGKSASQVLKEAKVSAPEVVKDIQQEAVNQAEAKLSKGKGTAQDVITKLSKGTGQLNLLANKEAIQREIERQKIIRQQIELEKKKEEIKKIPKKTEKIIKIDKKEKLSKKFLDKLQDWGSSINKREAETKKRQSQREAKLLANEIARKELVSEYIPTGFKTIGKGFSKLIKLGEETFTGTLGFGEALATAGEKAVFLLPALGASVAEEQTSNYAKEFVSEPQLNVLKEIYTDPKTYKDAAVGAATAVLMGGVKTGKGTAKSVSRLPKSTTKFSKGTVLRSSKGNVGIVGKGGVVKVVPKGMKTITRALTRDIKEFVIKDVKTFPKVSKARVGTVLRNKKGDLRIVTRGGKTIKTTASQKKGLIKAEKAGRVKRIKRTEVARLTKKALKEPLKSKEARTLKEAIKFKERKLSLKQFNKEVNRISRTLKLDYPQKSKFTKLYKRFTKNPNKSNIKALNKFENKALKLKAIKRKKIGVRKATEKEIKQFTKDPVKFLKDNKIPIREISESDMIGKLFSDKRFEGIKDIIVRKYDKTGKVTLPSGYTDGKSVTILKSLKGKNRLRVIKHEAIHVLKKDPYRKSLLEVITKGAIKPKEIRTKFLTKLKSTKFPLKKKVKVSRLKSIKEAKKTREFYKKRGTTKAKVDELKSFIKKPLRKLKLDSNEIIKLDDLIENIAFNKKGAKLKLENYVKKLKKQFEKKDVKLRKLEADKLSRKRGFKDFKEDFEYTKALKDYKDGIKGANKRLSNIESNIAKRKSIASKKLKKAINKSRNDIIKEANKLLREGRIKIKDKKYRIIKKRKKLSKEDTDRLAIAITQRLERIEEAKYRKQAKEALKEILKGNELSSRDPKLNAAIRRLLNKEQIQLLRKEKLLRIEKGLIKGKQPRVRLTKAQKRAIKLKAKEKTRLERIARKKAKRAPAGLKQARKIRRKQFLREIEREKDLLKRLVKDKSIQENYILDLSTGQARLIPKKKVKAKIKFAKDIIKKKKIKKGKQVKVNKDGTIQILETEKVKIAKKQNPKEAIKLKQKQLSKVAKELKQELQVKAKPKKVRVKPRLRVMVKKFNPDVLSRFKSVGLGTISTFKSLETVLNKVIVNQVKVINKDLTILNKVNTENKVKILNENIIKNENKIENVNKVLNKVLNKVNIKNLNKNEVRILNDTQSKLKQILVQTRKRRKKSTKETLKAIKIKLPKLKWQKEAPRGYRYKVDAYVNIRGIRKRVVKGLPENKAWNKAFSKGSITYRGVDKSTPQSLELVITGITKAKDDKRKIGINKVRKRIGKDPKVLKLVEYRKYAIDTKGEKQGLSIERKRVKRVKKMHSTTLKNKGFRSVIKPRTKRSADGWANRWRKKGYNARVIKYKKGYEVYVKRK